MTTKRITQIFFALLLIAVAASAQTYTYTFTAPAGAITCAYISPYQTVPYNGYQYRVENSTPPYPIPGIVAAPNHPIPVAHGTCPDMRGFVSSNGVTAEWQSGTPTFFKVNTSAGQVIQGNSVMWTVPNTYPAEGQSVAISADAILTSVCSPTCVAASGNVHLGGNWHFNWVVGAPYRGIVNVEKVWTDDEAEVDGSSTVAILDLDRQKREGFLELADLEPKGDWVWALIKTLEPVTIFF